MMIIKNDTGWHVCSLIVQVTIDKLDDVSEKLKGIPDTEIPGVNEHEGKMIVLMQASDANVLFANIESIRDWDGVLAVSLVYHQQDEQIEDKP